MRFLKSFRYAARGIIYCINNERNMRVHTVVMLYVFVFSPFFELSRGQYALLLVTMSSVLAAEMVNTACEGLSDLTMADYNPLARTIKDVAAGAVLICAIFAVCVGLCLFWRPEVFAHIFRWFAARWWAVVCLALSAVFALVFIILGPVGIRDRLWLRKSGKKRGV